MSPRSIGENEAINEEIPVPKPERSRQTPLPKLQLFIVFLIQFTEPLTATVIYPFVNQFVRDTGIIAGDERRTGYYAGIVGSLFFFSEAVTVFHWGWLSDRVGRRPIILLGPIGLAFSMLSFGLSSDFWSLAASRCLQGIFNGNIVVSKTVMAEITDPTNIADAFAMMPLMWSLGTTIGPILGGLLEEPVKKWPAVFRKIQIFKVHPYLLPCAAAGLIALLAGLIGFVALEETLLSALEKQKKQIHESDRCSAPSSPDDSSTPLLGGDIEGYGTGSQGRALTHERQGDGLINQDTVGAPKKPIEAAPPFRSLLIAQVVIPLIVYAVQAFVDMCNQVLLPLMYSTSIPVGGLGMDPYHIGIILSVSGCFNALAQLTLLAWLIRKIGPRNVNVLAQIGYVVNIGLYPLLGMFARRAGRVDAKVWAVIVIQLICRLTNGMGHGSIQIIIVDSAPSNNSLGAINGMAQALGCLARSIGPSVASSLFSLSLRRNLAGGNMVYIILSGCALLSLRLAYYLPSKLRSKSR